MKRKPINIQTQALALLFFCATGFGLRAQEKDAKPAPPQDPKAISAANNLVFDGNAKLQENNFVQAEGDYRKAISKNGQNAVAPYNLGNALYEKESYAEAFGRYKQAGEVSKDKAEKHKAFHNMGNVFMKQEQYDKAVEAYKESLRNDPTDEETRYNLALAKEKLKKQQQQNKDQNKDQKDKDQDKKDQNDKNKDQKDQGDNKNDKGDDQNKDQDKDKGDQKDQGDQGKDKQDPQENKQGDGDEKKEEQKKPQQQQPRPNQLSPQQVQNLLEAMQNEEKKVQQKMEAQKVKGVPMQTDKDW